MIKALLITLLLAVLFFLAGVSNIFAIMAHKASLYVAFILLVVVLITARVVLKAHGDKEIKDEEDDK